MSRRGIGAVLAAVALTLALLPVSAAAAGAVTGRTIATLEFIGFAGTVADYTGTCSPAACTAIIDWGDGTATTVGTFAGSSGAWTVSGTHTYSEDGSWTTTTTVSDNSATPSGAGTANIGESISNPPPGSGVPIGVAEGQFFIGPVASFQDPSSVDPASAFTAMVDWGDGTTTAGTVTGAGGTYFVTGSHIYSDELLGTYVVTISESAVSGPIIGTAMNGVLVTEGDTLTPTVGVNGSGTEGSAFSGSAAHFSDTNPSAVAGDFTATIDWGDGTTTAGSVIAAGGGFNVTGSHSYADEGIFSTVATLTDDAPGTATASAAGTADIADADNLSGSLATVTAPNEGAAFSGIVANYTDTYTANTAADLGATIDWGDGTTTAGTVAGGGGSFTVSGNHTYAEDGDHPMVVALFDDAPGTAINNVFGLFHVDEGFFSEAAGAAINLSEGTPFSGTVATFSDPGSPDAAAAFSATIDWGDGTTTAGTVTGAAGSFSVAGSHTYADEFSGNYAVTVMEATAGFTIGPVGATVTITEGDALAAVAGFLSGTEGAPATVSADFTGAAAGNTAADFTGTIVWGDGATTAGTVTGGSGDFTVAGTHTYVEQGSYNWTVTLTDDAPGTSSAATSSTVVIADAALSGSAHNQHTTAGVALTNVVVGTFTDQQKESLGSYTATINWGDGTTTTGTVTDPPGTLNVSGSHTYASAGSFALTATLTDIGGPSFTTLPATATVDPATPSTAGSDKPLPVLPAGLVVLGLGLLLGAGILRRRRAS